MSAWSDLGLRTRTALLIGLVTLGLLWLPPLLQRVALLVWGALLLREAVRLVEAAGTAALYKLLFLFYVGLGIAATLWLVGLKQDTIPGLALLVVSAWIVDSAAYLGGRLIGGPKLAPAISPNKTWSGLLSGVAALLAAAWLLGFGLWSLVLALSIAPIMQAGDLTQSVMKRRAGLSDSGNILPGHGGWLDRYDGALAAAPVWVLLLEFAI